MKTYDDLAIGGAPPAFVEPLHVGRPNIGSKQTFLNYANEMLDRGWLTNNGPLVQEFEEKVKCYLDVKHCIAVCNGTVALEIAIRALELSGEVIVPSYTFIATAHALYWQGIKPVFADIDPVTHNLDPESVRSLITSRTTAIIGVHLWGRAAPISALEEIATEYGLQLMFDAAHAFGCSYNKQMIGNYGNAEVFSFHATKFFNTLEGGAVVTNDDQIAEKIRLMRNFGFAGYDNVVHPGTNGKMTEICAAMGLTNFNHMQEVLKENERCYNEYAYLLSEISAVRLCQYDLHEKNNFQYIVLEVAQSAQFNRDDLVTALHAENVLARKYFWPGCHQMLPYREKYPVADSALPVTCDVAERVIVLPAGPLIRRAQITVISDVIRILSRI